MEKEIKKAERILHLTLKKKWYDMISCGEKKEEYREIKPYWQNRLELPLSKVSAIVEFKKFDFIIFKNGYSKDSPSMKVECKGIKFDYSKAEWCDGVEDYFYVIKLGKVIWDNKLR
jgi:hypothetical protein